MDLSITNNQDTIAYQAQIDMNRDSYGRVESYQGDVNGNGFSAFTQNILNRYNPSNGGLEGATGTKNDHGNQYQVEITRYCPQVQDPQLTGYQVKVFAPPYNGQETVVGICN